MLRFLRGVSHFPFHHPQYGKHVERKAISALCWARRARQGGFRPFRRRCCGGGGGAQGTRPAHARPTEWGRVRGGRPGQRVVEQGTWASRTRKRSKAGCGRPEDGGVGTAKTVKLPPQQLAQPQYANYWAPLTRKRHILPHSAQRQHTNRWAPRTRRRHQQEHRPQRPTESSDPTQHAKGRTGDCPGPRKETTTRRNVIQGGHDA